MSRNDEPLIDLRAIFSGMDFDSQMFVFGCFHNHIQNDRTLARILYSKENIAFLKEFYARDYVRHTPFFSGEPTQIIWALVMVAEDGDDFDHAKHRKPPETPDDLGEDSYEWEPFEGAIDWTSFDEVGATIELVPERFSMGALLATLTPTQARIAFEIMATADHDWDDETSNIDIMVDLASPDNMAAVRRYALDPATDPVVRLSLDLAIRQLELLHEIAAFGKANSDTGIAQSFEDYAALQRVMIRVLQVATARDYDVFLASEASNEAVV